jgi:hypothetical protein
MEFIAIEFKEEFLCLFYFLIRERRDFFRCFAKQIAKKTHVSLSFLIDSFSKQIDTVIAISRRTAWLSGAGADGGTPSKREQA